MLNQVQLIGNLGADPEFFDSKPDQYGAVKQFCRFSLATTKRFKNGQSEQKEDTNWHRVAIMADGLAGVCKSYVKKGSKLFVQGELRNRKYTDKDGVERWATDIIVGSFGGKLELLDKREGGTKPPPTGNDIDDEIPF